MSKIKEMLEEIKNAVDEETRGKIAATLGKINSEYSELHESLDIVKNESVKRKEKIRDELMPKITKYEDEIEDWKKKADTSEIQEELTGLRDFKKSQLKTQRTSFVKSFDEIAKHENFEKAKTRFVLPEAADGKYDFEKTSDEDMEKNINALNGLNELDYFKDGGKEKPATFGDKFKNTQETKQPEIKHPSDLHKHLTEALVNSDILDD